MADKNNVPMPVIRRLPRYYRYLTKLLAAGKTHISSKELAERMGLTASQIRHDFNCFGGFGQQGYGYNVEQLTAEIKRILFLDSRLSAVLVGMGNLGRALRSYLEHDALGIELCGLFDKTTRRQPPQNLGLEIMDISRLEAFCAEKHPQVAILCIPEKDACAIADRLYACGVRGIWNFSHAELHLPHDCCVENVHLGDSLMSLGYMVHTAD